MSTDRGGGSISSQDPSGSRRGSSKFGEFSVPSSSEVDLILRDYFHELHYEPKGRRRQSSAGGQRRASDDPSSLEGPFSHMLDPKGKYRSLEEQETILFSELLKEGQNEEPEVDLVRKYFGPEAQQIADQDESKKPGFVPISTQFHAEPAYVDDESSAKDQLVKNEEKAQERAARRAQRERMRDSIRLPKGEFSFPHRTYAPKVQIPHKVIPGKIPQSVAIERLHRLYKKADLEKICESFGILPFDLMPPPNYGESSERFGQETMFRNRIRVLGVDKREIILKHFGKVGQDTMFETEGQDSYQYDNHGGPSAGVDFATPSESSAFRSDTISTFSSTNTSTNTNSKSQHSQINHGLVAGPGGDFLKFSRPHFCPSLPLDYFDNEEFDIRSGPEWIKLGWDRKERRKYPIPGKAFLPMPLRIGQMDDSSTITRETPEEEDLAGEGLKSLSELTHEELLLRNDRLKKFRTWLLKERQKRLDRHTTYESIQEDAEIGPIEGDQIETDTTKVSSSLTSNDMKKSSGRGVEDGAKLSLSLTSSTMSSVNPAVVSRGQKVQISSSNNVEDKGRSVQLQDIKEENGGDDSDSGSSIDGKSPDEDFLKELRRKNVQLDETDLALEMIVNLVHRGKTQVSELEENQNTLDNLSSMGLTAQTLDDDDDTGSGRTDLNSVEGSIRGDSIHEESDQGPNNSASADQDPYEDPYGHEKYVYDFDKMKKVHIYDWQWAEVAVFDYNPENRKYLVRTIFEPYVYAWVGKVYLCFDGENPAVHVKRILDALHRRILFENILRYNLYVDCLPHGEVPSMDKSDLERIFKKALINTPKLAISQDILKNVQNEINLEYERVENMAKFNMIVQKHPRVFKPWVMFPPKRAELLASSEEGDGKWRYIVARQISKSNFKYKVIRLQKLSVIFAKEPYEALGEIIMACQQARSKRLILTNLQQPLLLKAYDKLQKDNMEEVQRFLRDIWMESILSSVRDHLKKIPKSWYNINESRWDIYSMSKTSGYLNLIKFMMEDTLRWMVLESLEAFVKELEKLMKNCQYGKDYQWGGDLTVSEFPTPSPHKPPFLLDLTIDRNGPRYSHLLGRFRVVSAGLCTAAVETANRLPDIVSLIMEKLLFGTQKTLRSVQMGDKKVIRLKDKLFHLLRKGLIPVDHYAQKYQRYTDLHNLDVHAFMKKWESSNKSMNETMIEVEKHLTQIRLLESEIPIHLDINAFRVNTDVIRQTLINKEKSLYTMILEQYAATLRAEIRRIKEEYGEMEKKLNIRSEDIYEVMDLKKFLQVVPEKVEKLEVDIAKILQDYELFGQFTYQIPSEDYEAKWQAAMYSQRIMRMTEEASTWLDEDFERLLKVQQSDLAELSDWVDSVSLAVAGLAGFTELEKAPEVATEVKKVWKMVRDLEEQSSLLNQRQAIFSLPPAQNEALNRLVNDIEPYKNLWFTAADWLRIQENCFKGTMDKIELDQIIKIMSEGEGLILECIETFNGADGIQQVAKEVARQMDEFKPLVPLIQTLKNPGMRQRHWEAISEICGFPVVARGNISFKKLLDQGLRKHIKKLSQIGVLATRELELEKSLDEMLKQTAELVLKVDTDEGTGLQIILLEPETLETLNQFFETTARIVQSPYKEPFLDLLDTWETKINNAKKEMDIWLWNQEIWLGCQRKLPEIPNLEKSDQKIILRMERIWRRLIRFARDNPDLLSICSDVTVIVSLNQFSELALKIQTSLQIQV